MMSAPSKGVEPKSSIARISVRIETDIAGIVAGIVAAREKNGRRRHASRTGKRAA